METETPAESIIVDEAENQSFLGFKFGALINSEKSVDFQQLRKTLSTMDCSSGFRGNGGRRADVGHVTSTIARRDVWSATRRSKFADRRWARKLSARSHFGLATAVPCFQGEDDQKVVNFEQILFANGRTLHSTEAPAQRARAFSLTF
jgi:hypothetical protein